MQKVLEMQISKLTAALGSFVCNLDPVAATWGEQASVCRLLVYTNCSENARIVPYWNASLCIYLQRERVLGWVFYWNASLVHIPARRTSLGLFPIGTRPCASTWQGERVLCGFLLERFLTEALFVNSQPT